MSAQPPDGPPQLPPPGSLRCPRCSATIGPDQDWCLECGAPARTRLAPTPNWQLPTVAIGAIVALAGALLAFAFVRLTDDDGSPPAGTTPTAVVESAPPAAIAPPPAATTQPTGTTATQPTGTTATQPTGTTATQPTGTIPTQPTGTTARSSAR